MTIATRTRHEAVALLRQTVDDFDWSSMTPGRLSILEAFLRLTATQGYGAVTMRALGRQLNIKAPSLYSHFPEGKDEVVRLALQWRYLQWSSEVIAAVEDAHNPHEFLEALISHHVRGQLLSPESDMFDLLIAADRIGNVLPADARANVEKVVGMYHLLFESALTDLGYGGTLGAPPPSQSLFWTAYAPGAIGTAQMSVSMKSRSSPRASSTLPSA